MNIPGYGPSRVWIPPIKAPNSLLAIYDRYSLTSAHSTLPMTEGLIDWVLGLGSGDAWDGFWYNNAKASGD